jgi:hypothetical protein
MILLKDKENVTAPGGDYPYGVMRDKTPSIAGSKANTEFMNDYVQFFEKMFAESGISANDLPDNDYSGFQLYEALLEITKPRPYKVYTALLSQSGTSAPSETVLGDNDIGSIVWARTSAGFYTGTLSGAFVSGKTALFFDPGTNINNTAAGDEWHFANVSTGTVQLKTYEGAVLTDSKLLNATVEIRVYNY